MKAVLVRWDEKEEKKIWGEAIFIFDSSTLLNFYEFSENARSKIYQKIFSSLNDRLWITNQTEFEFLKNQPKVLRRPNELYDELKQKHFPARHFKTFVQQYEHLKQITSKDTRHPYISKNTFSTSDRLVEQLQSSIEGLEKALDKQIEERKKENVALTSTDKLLTFFQVTDGFSFNEILEIVKEGELIYRQTIPPGYKDEKDKVGIGKYGDLIIWKQIIKLAQKLKKPVLMIIDDLKDDWCYTDKADKSKMYSPRVELIKEMKDIGGVSFWSYSLPQFLYKAEKILGFKVESEVINEVKEVSRVQQEQLILESILNWAKDRFNADSSILANNYWQSDTGVDIIQTLDGVAFGIIVKRLMRDMSSNSIKQWVKQIEEARSRSYTFEMVTLLVVAEDEHLAKYMQGAMVYYDKNVSIVIGYMNSAAEFIEVYSHS